MRLLTLVAVLLAIASAFLLYGLNYETRQIEAKVLAQERLVEQTRNDIAVLKAERAHLAHPQRIEPLARALGLQPPEPGQFSAHVGETGEASGSTRARTAAR